MSEHRADRIQEGVFHRSGETPPPFSSVVFLRRQPGAALGAMREALALAYDTMVLLRAGRLPELPEVEVAGAGMTVLIGFGRRLFEDPPLSQRLPTGLRTFRSPAATGGGPVLSGAGLEYEGSVTDNPGDADVVFHFRADTALAVERAVVELWRSVAEHADVFTVIAAYTGHTRDDKRSWIGFFDGTSNLRSDQRLQVIEIKTKQVSDHDEWTELGTYLAFMRVNVNLEIWRPLSRVVQESLVGRDKVSGCPLVDIDPSTGPVPAAGCPVSGTDSVEEPGNRRFLEASIPGIHQVALRESHIHRANHQRTNIADPDSRRIYRQGTEFFEGIGSDGAPRVGLNFISFQDDPTRLTQMLTQPGWLGGTNFGGNTQSQPNELHRILTVSAAGIFIVPPVEPDQPFPGAGLFTG